MGVALGSLIGVHGHYGTSGIIFFDLAYAQRLVRFIIIQYHSFVMKDVYIVCICKSKLMPTFIYTLYPTSLQYREHLQSLIFELMFFLGMVPLPYSFRIFCVSRTG